MIIIDIYLKYLEIVYVVFNIGVDNISMPIGIFKEIVYLCRWYIYVIGISMSFIIAMPFGRSLLFWVRIEFENSIFDMSFMGM